MVAAREVSRQVEQEQRDRTNEYFGGNAESKINYARRRSIDLINEAETARFQKSWLVRQLGDTYDPDEETDESDEYTDDDELEARRESM